MKNLLLKRIIPFLSTFLIGFLIFNTFISVSKVERVKESKIVANKSAKQFENGGTGFAACSGSNNVSYHNFQSAVPVEKKKECETGFNKPLKILSKSKAEYTAEARNVNISGRISLRATFTASGQIENISVIRGLPFGLTEQAINAVQNIKFEPEIKCGVPVSRAKTIEYNFDIY